MAPTLDRASILGIPGDPLSAIAAFLVLARPLLEGLQGRSEAHPRRSARLSAAWSQRHAYPDFVRGKPVHGKEAVLQVVPVFDEGAHRFRAEADSNALISMAGGAREYVRGDLVEVIAY